MTREQKREYLRAYRAEGFGALADKRYYRKNAERLRAEAHERYERRKAREKVSRETGDNLQNSE